MLPEETKCDKANKMPRVTKFGVSPGVTMFSQCLESVRRNYTLLLLVLPLSGLRDMFNVTLKFYSLLTIKLALIII